MGTEAEKEGVPEHLTGHLLAMGELHRAGRYDRQAHGVQRVTGLYTGGEGTEQFDGGNVTPNLWSKSESEYEGSRNLRS